MTATHFPDGITSFGAPVGLPPIMGKYIHVIPGLGKSDNSGLNSTDSVDSLATAYNLCGDGTGDGIIVWSYGSTSANTTSYLSSSLVWAKNGITVFGVCGPTMMGQRARVANKSTVNTLTYLINVTGTNNAFYNLEVANFGSDATALGGMIVTGYRNYFANCQFIGAGHATPAILQGANSITLQGTQECTFDNCVFGTDTIDQVATSVVNGVIVFAGGCERNTFNNCVVLSYYSASSATSGAILHYGAGDSITRHQYFNNCLFANYKAGALDSNPPLLAIVGTAPNNGAIILKYPMLVGFAAADGANNRTYVVAPVPTGGTAGKAVKVA